MAKPIEPPCPACHEPTTFAIYSGTSGNNIAAWCLCCWRPVTANGVTFYARKLFSEIEYAALPMLPGADMKRCPRCQKLAKLEVHHYAPRALFGEDCETYAKGELCRACHERWHAVIGQPIGSPSAPETIARRVLQPNMTPIEQQVLRMELADAAEE